MKCKDCIHFPVCCISADADSDYADRCKQILLPTPKGKWIRLDNGSYMCSECYENDYPWKDYKYCPNCGANMVADLCSICKHGDNCERSDKGISFANHSSCWKFER